MGTIKKMAKIFAEVMFLVATVIFLIVADIIGFFTYPIYSWKQPNKASSIDSISKLIGWRWFRQIISFLEDRSVCICILDRLVVCLWYVVFLHWSPMKKRKYFIMAEGCHYIKRLSVEKQVEFFKACDFDKQVWVAHENALSEEAIKSLFYDNIKPFVYAGRVPDDMFSAVGGENLRYYMENFSLSLIKQRHIITKLFSYPEGYKWVLCQYIKRRGLHPSAVTLFYNKWEGENKKNPVFEEVIKAIQERQDFVTVTKYNNSVAFAKYIKQREGKLGYDAQVAMRPWQYELFHKLDYKLSPRAIRSKLVNAFKSTDDTVVAQMMMANGEIADCESAMLQVAGDERLSALWLSVLSKA